MTANNKFRKETDQQGKITAHLNKLNHNSVSEGGLKNKNATTVNKRADELFLNVSFNPGASLRNKGGHMFVNDWCC